MLDDKKENNDVISKKLIFWKIGEDRGDIKMVESIPTGEELKDYIAKMRKRVMLETQKTGLEEGEQKKITDRFNKDTEGLSLWQIIIIKNQFHEKKIWGKGDKNDV